MHSATLSDRASAESSSFTPGWDEADILHAEVCGAELQYRKSLVITMSHRSKVIVARGKLARAIAKLKQGRYSSSSPFTSKSVGGIIHTSSLTNPLDHHRNTGKPNIPFNKI
jgi:hypothetical protein